MSAERVCRRCLLAEMGDDPYFRSIAEYVAALPERVKAPDAEYRRRLALCKGCGELANGICAQCGCFVELRAAKRQNRCPAFPPRWEGMAAAQEDEPL